MSGPCPCPRLKPYLDGRRAWCGGQPEADRTVVGDSGVDGVAMAARISRILELPAASRSHRRGLSALSHQPGEPTAPASAVR